MQSDIKSTLFPSTHSTRQSPGLLTSTPMHLCVANTGATGPIALQIGSQSSKQDMTCCASDGQEMKIGVHSQRKMVNWLAVTQACVESSQKVYEGCSCTQERAPHSYQHLRPSVSTVISVIPIIAPQVAIPTQCSIACVRKRVRV